MAGINKLTIYKVGLVFFGKKLVRSSNPDLTAPLTTTKLLREDVEVGQDAAREATDKPQAGNHKPCQSSSTVLVIHGCVRLFVPVNKQHSFLGKHQPSHSARVCALLRPRLQIRLHSAASAHPAAAVAFISST